MSYLLDTHVLLWWFGDVSKLSSRQHRVLSSASGEDPLLVAGITLWEIAALAKLGRIRLKLPLRDWLECATAAPLVNTLPLTPTIAAELATLPDRLPCDPADRILVATARVHGATLVTRDAGILDADLVSTLA